MKQNGVDFNLSKTFLDKYKNKQPVWGPLGYFTYKRTYARDLGNGATEEFWQTLQRVVEACFLVQKIHCKDQHIPWDNRKAQKSAQEMYERMWHFKFLPPGRGLANMGSPAMWIKGGACLNNCGFVSTKDIKTDFSGPFAWLMEMSLHGVGVGFDTLGAQVDLFLKTPRASSEKHIAEDSREGWVECFKRLLDAYVGADTLPSEWDLTKIRPKGTPIKTFGGIAPGPGPLRELLEKAKKRLDEYVAADAPVDSTLIVDLMNLAGAAVVAGGVRRTAEIAFGEYDDIDFLFLKSEENINAPNSARWASNNSIKAPIGANYSGPGWLAGTYGEPGFFWLDNAQSYGRLKDGTDRRDWRVLGCNPCGEQSLENFELCNLVETYPAHHDSLEDYKRTLKFAYMYAKTVTLVKTHDQRTNAVMLRNRRIGLSQSGIVQQLEKVGFREHMKWCDESYRIIREWDDIYSEWLCVSRSIKVTSVKPSGTISLLCGATPGIHFPHSPYYIRRVRVAKNTDLWRKMAEAGYRVEPDLMQPEYTVIVEFPVKEENFSRAKDDVSIWEQLELAAQMQYWWSDNQVSITVTVKPEEISDVPRALSMYESRLKAVSFLPIDPNQTYKQAPYESITEEEYEERIKEITEPDLNLTNEKDRVVEKFCDSDGCQI